MGDCVRFAPKERLERVLVNPRQLDTKTYLAKRGIINPPISHGLMNTSPIDIGTIRRIYKFQDPLTKFSQSIDKLAASFKGNPEELSKYFAERAQEFKATTRFKVAWRGTKDIYEDKTITGASKPVTAYTDEHLVEPELIATERPEEKKAVILPQNDGYQHLVIGDLHGDLEALKQILETYNILPRLLKGEKLRLIFLGDYVDKGKESLKVLLFLLELHKQFPDNIILIRGNHEDKTINSRDGFYNEIQEKYGINISTNKACQDSIQQLFEQLPYFAILNTKIFFHGGIPFYNNRDGFNLSLRSFLSTCHSGCNMLWGDPAILPGDDRYDYNHSRGAGGGLKFDVVKIHKELAAIDVDLIIRAHEAANLDIGKTYRENGLITVFSTGYPSDDTKYPENNEPFVLEIAPEESERLATLPREERFKEALKQINFKRIFERSPKITEKVLNIIS